MPQNFFSQNLMENFIVSARKYRPASFASVVGQASITRTLKSAIKNNHIAQAFLFTGPRGVGKTTCARILAKTINCTNLSENAEACDECPSCKSFNLNASFNILELDAASNNSVDDIRSLVDQVRIPPQAGKYKVYIIDEVHMLSASAFNAFLKTLEEPPAYAKFILATTEKHKIIPTILSRCQIYDFHRITVDDIAHHLQYVADSENIEAEGEALHIIAQKADGALRDALSIFDQIVSFAGRKITYQSVIENLNVLDYDYYFRVASYVHQSDISSALLLLNEIIEKGFDGHQFINGFGEHLRNLLVCKDESTVKLLEVADSTRKRYLEQSREIPLTFLIKALDINNKADLSYKNVSNKRLQIELSLLQMASLSGIADSNTVTSAQQKIPETKTVNTEIKDAPKPALPQNPAVSYQQTNPPAPPEVKEPTQVTPPPADLNTLLTRIPSMSIKDAGNTVKEPSTAAEEYIEKPGDNPIRKQITDEEVKKAILKYAEQISDTQTAFSACLKANPPSLAEGNIIHLPIDNIIFSDKQTQRSLLEFLRSELNNLQIWIETEFVKTEPAQERPTRPEDKFRHMAQKNPELENFARQLDLGLDV